MGALLAESVSEKDEHYNNWGMRIARRCIEHNEVGKVFGLSSGIISLLFNVPSMTITGVFIGDGSPSMCNYNTKPLQRKYSRNILGPLGNFYPFKCEWTLLENCSFVREG